MGRVKDKVAVVTGASSGIGAATSRLLAREGATVYLADIDNDNGKAVAGEIDGNVHFVSHDVRYEENWQRLLDRVFTEQGRLDILVNNAGIAIPASIENQSEPDYRTTMAVCIDGVFFGCKHAIPCMASGGGGSIVNVSSILSLAGSPPFPAYSAAKGAIESLTRTIAVHCATLKNGIRCNSVHPGGIATPMGGAVRDKLVDAGFGLPGTDQQPDSSNRLGEPEDVAYPILFLACGESSFINGEKIVVDAGASVMIGAVPA